MSNANGRMIKLSQGRIVYVGYDDETYYLAFRNKEKEDTYLKLSKEAGDALMTLLSNPNAGDEGTFPHKTRWVVVRSTS